MGRHEEGPFLTEGGVSEVDPRSGSFVRVAVPVPLLPSLVYRVPDGTMLREVHAERVLGGWISRRGGGPWKRSVVGTRIRGPL